MTREEILEKYLKSHNDLGTRKEAKDKERFDKEHQKIWAECDKELAKLKD